LVVVDLAVAVTARLEVAAGLALSTQLVQLAVAVALSHSPLQALVLVVRVVVLVVVLLEAQLVVQEQLIKVLKVEMLTVRMSTDEVAVALVKLAPMGYFSCLLEEMEFLAALQAQP
jgi:hypothetical protein